MFVVYFSKHYFFGKTLTCYRNKTYNTHLILIRLVEDKRISVLTFY